MSRRIAPARMNDLAHALDKYYDSRETDRVYDRFKPAIDLAVAIPLFILTLPVMLVAWSLVRFSSRGPGIYRQIRTGRHGRPFHIYKLRTMYHNCEVMSGICWSQRGDPRVTPLGRVLRRCHIDELPQLWNVIRGDMSLVGPRPERPEFVGPLDRAIPGYCGRLRVKPGVTGLAQIQLPPDSDFQSVHRKLTLDLRYVEGRSPLLDFRLLLGTALYLVGFSYSLVGQAMALPNKRLEQLHSIVEPAMTSVSPPDHKCETMLQRG